MLDELDRLHRDLSGLLEALRSALLEEEEADVLMEDCERCRGLGVLASCRCHSSAQCPAATDVRCEDCDGEGKQAVACDAHDAGEAPPGCRAEAARRCPNCDEALCSRHLAWHRAECAPTPAAVHARDEDCTVGPDGCCTGCGASHGGVCACSGRAYHRAGCPEVG